MRLFRATLPGCLLRRRVSGVVPAAGAVFSDLPRRRLRSRPLRGRARNGNPGYEDDEVNPLTMLSNVLPMES